MTYNTTIMDRFDTEMLNTILYPVDFIFNKEVISININSKLIQVEL